MLDCAKTRAETGRKCSRHVPTATSTLRIFAPRYAGGAAPRLPKTELRFKSSSLILAKFQRPPICHAMSFFSALTASSSSSSSPSSGSCSGPGPVGAYPNASSLMLRGGGGGGGGGSLSASALAAAKRCTFGASCTNFRCAEAHPPSWVRPMDPKLKCTWKVPRRAGLGPQADGRPARQHARAAEASGSIIVHFQRTLTHGLF